MIFVLTDGLGALLCPVHDERGLGSPEVGGLVDGLPELPSGASLVSLHATVQVRAITILVIHDNNYYFPKKK